MIEFEVRERDGLARLGRFSTPHGMIETPALLPVVHPDPKRQPLAPSEIRRRFGFSAVITSSYIAWRSPELRPIAEAQGIHRLLGFDGPVMTDSGAFQQHAYGHIEVSPETILDFQEQIGSDIATVLDVFVEPDLPHADAALGVEATLERARAARARRSGLLAVPVQGARYPDLRARSASGASEVGDVLAVGGVVPLFEQYRFRELAGVLLAARPHLTPAAAVHLFGTGHPMTFAFAALVGVDLFDSSAYHKFARRGRLLFPEGTVAVDELDEPLCQCSLCSEMPLAKVAGLPPDERERAIALHNLLTSAEEMGRVRQAIRDGTLWELAERRATAHPALLAGVAALKQGDAIFQPTEPESRRAFRETGPTSYDRPAVGRWRRKADEYRAGRIRARTIPRFPLVPAFLERIPVHDRDGGELRWECPSPFGAVPLELTDVYPVGPALTEAEFRADGPSVRKPSTASTAVRDALGRDEPSSLEWSEAWTRLQLEATLEWRYGRPLAQALMYEGLLGARSRRTGRLRWATWDGRPAFQFGNDGMPRPTFAGGELLRAHASPSRERVVVSPDAVPFVREGRSLFARFVQRADPALAPGMSALLVDGQDELLAVGRLLLAPHEMRTLRRGVAVRVTAHRHAPSEPLDAEANDEHDPGEL
jgi:7-cyano-7-deazaguanine tRNA-ribosyltransferase